MGEGGEGLQYAANAADGKTLTLPTSPYCDVTAKKSGACAVPSRTTITEIHPVTGKSGSRRLATLVFLGDMSMGGSKLDRLGHKNAAHRLETDPWSFAELLAPLVEDKSLLATNLETVLTR